MNPMTPKERVLAFYQRKPTDAMPTSAGIHIKMNSAVFKERPPQNVGGLDCFGVDWVWDEITSALTPDPKQPPIMEDICDWREVIQWPDLEACPWDRADELDHMDEVDRENEVLVFMLENGPFERLHFLMGFENALCALLTDPEEVEAFFDAFVEWKIRLIEKIAQYYKPDVLMFHDDWGTQQNTFFSPDTWRALIKPQMKKIVNRCHELGIIFELHSCGKMESIVPEFVEIGIDVWQGQEINDIAALREITGDKLGYRSTPDYQRYYTEMIGGSMDEEMVRESVRKTLKLHAQGGNYLPSVMPFGGRVYEILKEEIEALQGVPYDQYT